MSQEELFINGELLRLRREARGWLLNDMATRACMSVKQIRQIEEGGMSSFYSSAVKVTAAKKVAALLGLSDEEVFAHHIEPAPAQEIPIQSSISEHVEGTSEPEVDNDNLGHFHSESEITPFKQVEAETSTVERKSKTSLWLISALFAAALGVAAFMQPRDELVSDSIPPIQDVPTDATDPASSASDASIESVASDVIAPSASAPFSSQKSASTAAYVASGAPNSSRSSIGVSASPLGAPSAPKEP